MEGEIDFGLKHSTLDIWAGEGMLSNFLKRVAIFLLDMISVLSI
jgi:hypothetical protein